MTSQIEFLTSRRSIPAAFLREPGPNASQLDQILTAGIRVPDHGKLAPWRFIILDGDRRLRAGEALLRSRLDRGDILGADERTAETERFNRAPMVIGVVSRSAPHVKIPEVEQLLSAGAVCMNILNGAHALGFAAQWLTDWPVYDRPASVLLGLSDQERFVGFVHIGKPTSAARERPRPTAAELVSRWQPPPGYG